MFALITIWTFLGINPATGNLAPRTTISAIALYPDEKTCLLAESYLDANPKLQRPNSTATTFCQAVLDGLTFLLHTSREVSAANLRAAAKALDTDSRVG